MKAKDILKETRKLLKNPRHWTKGTMARDRHGCSVPVASPQAASWCLSGAIRLVSDKSKSRQISQYKATRVLSKVLDGRLLSDWNDNTKRQHSEVIEALDSAIKVADDLDRKHRAVRTA